MLLYFKVRNYRSFRDESMLDMQAAKLSDNHEMLLTYGKENYLPAIAIYGKNGGGKSNLIRAMWLAVQFIRNAQRTQTEKSPVPVRPFALDDYSQNEPTSFEFCYVDNGIKYAYGFSATRERIINEYLKSWPKGRESNIFYREGQQFVFPKNSEKKRKELISEVVGPNQLYFAISCTMNYKPCIEAMQWFREKIVFSRDYTDIHKSLLENEEDEAMLSAIVDAAKTADTGITDIRFEFNSQEIKINKDGAESKTKDMIPAIPGMLSAIRAFQKALQENGNEAEIRLSEESLKSTTYHLGKKQSGELEQFELTLSDESDGTRRLMTLAPAIEKTLSTGGVFIVDELEREMHIKLTEYILGKYLEKTSNKADAQIIFTTHEVSLLNQELLRRDQIYFVDKDRQDGSSELYSLADFSVRNDSNLQKAYLLGKFGAIPLIEVND